MTQTPAVQKAFDIVENDISKVLGLRTSAGQEVTPGQFVARKELNDVPQLSWNGPAGKYLLMKIDLDAPFPSLNFMSLIAHYIQSDVTIGAGRLIIDQNVTPIAAWAPPGPPPGSSPHRYVFLLFQQPDQFKASSVIPGGQSLGMMSKVRFDLNGFLEKNGFAKEPVAATYLTSN